MSRNQPEALFGRYWKVVAATDVESRTLENIAIEFNGVRTADTKPGELELTLYNLNDDTKRFIERRGVNIELHLGYKDFFGLVFKGAVEFGATQMTPPSPPTKLVIRDGAIQWRNVVINKTFKKGTPQERVIEELVKQLTGLPPNIQAEFQRINQGAKETINLQTADRKASAVPLTKQQRRETRVNKRDSKPVKVQKYLAQQERQQDNAAVAKQARGRVYHDAAFKKLNILCRTFGLTAKWDLQKLTILPEGLVQPREVRVIAPGSGLIGSPEVIEASKFQGQTLQTGIKFMCSLHHELAPGTLVQLESEVYKGPLLIRRLEFKGQSHGGGEWCNVVECVIHKGAG